MELESKHPITQGNRLGPGTNTAWDHFKRTQNEHVAGPFRTALNDFFKIHTGEWTLNFTRETALEYIENYRCSENRERRAIAADLEDML